MKSLDVKKEETRQLLTGAMQLITDGEVEKGAEQMVAYWEGLAQELVDAQAEYARTNDSRILAERGVRTLTTEEREFYDAFIPALQSNNYRQAVTGLDITIPTSTFEDVFTNLKADYPILNYVEFMYTPNNVRLIYNTAGRDKAVWGKLTDEVTKEIAGALEEMESGKHSLTAFIYVNQAMLELGAEWIDAYVRTLLSNSSNWGLADGFVSGNGLDEPIGMIRDLEEAIDQTTGYAAKTPVELKSLSIEDLGAILKPMKKDRAGNSRSVGTVFFAYNPEDEATVLAARKVLGPNGYIDVVPYNIDFVECDSVPAEQAIIGIKGRYLGTVAGSKAGGIDFDDSYKFLEQNRTYLVKLYGNGTPKDNTSFVVADISGLKPLLPQVETVVPTP